MTDIQPPFAAILADSAPRLRAQAAAVTLRIWHHLASEEAALLLFEPFRADGHAYPLVEAMLLSAALPQLRFRMPIAADRIRTLRTPLTEALTGALDDIFGKAGHPGMASAWADVLHRLLEQIATRAEVRFI